MTQSGPTSGTQTTAPEQVAEFRQRLLAWFEHHGRSYPWRKKSATNYQRILSEIILQRTQADTVAAFVPRFLKSFPSWRRLAQATEEELQELFKPIGLWRQRAASLHRLAREMAKRRGRFPREREQVEALPGIGQYIANAVLMFCHGEPQPLLDVSMARVLERYFKPRQLVDIRRDPHLQALAKEVVTAEDAIRVNWAILDLAALVCKRTTPQCDSCPVSEGCRFPREQATLGRKESTPVKG